MRAVADFSILSRRRLLKLALGAGVLVCMGPAGLFTLRGRAQRVAGLRCLSDHEYRTLTALAHALFPRGGGIALGAEDLDLARDLDAFLADEPAWNRADLKRALLLLEIGPIVFAGTPRTFSHLNVDERVEHFAAWATSGMALRRQVSLAFRRLLSMAFYDRPEAWKDIGYEGPLIHVPGRS